MTDIRISIITISYKNAEGLKKTIESVASQTFRNFEFIIIDGGSEDGSKEIIMENKDIISHWVSERDSGIYNAMNKGIRYASGDYCIFMNSGDCFHDSAVLSRCAPLLGSGKDFYVGHQINTGAKSRIIKAPRDVNATTLAVKFLSHQATFIRTGLLRQRPYDESLRIVSDWKQMYTELIFNNASYERIDCIIADFDTTGISHTTTITEHVDELRKMLPPRIFDCILPQNDFNRKIAYALYKESKIERDMKILRNAFKQLIKDLFHL